MFIYSSFDSAEVNKNTKNILLVEELKDHHWQSPKLRDLKAGREVGTCA